MRRQNSGVRSQNSSVRFADGFDFLVIYLHCAELSGLNHCEVIVALRKYIIVGGIRIGGGAPVTVQSMTTTKASDVSGTVAQINRLTEAGCDIVRVAVPDMESADAIGEIKSLITVPLVADIHFNYKLAVRAAEAGADKIRINPGNIGSDENVRAVADICRVKGIPIRVGVNGGSVSKAILAKHNGLTVEAMYDSALENIRLLNKFDFDDICISVKTSSVPLTIAAYKMLYERTEYPLHLGVTETGPERMGTVKSSIGIGALLAMGIGDTIRVSLTAPHEREIEVALMILRALGLRKEYELISCPTCGRCGIDLIPIATEVERRLDALNLNITVAVMGCSVNGPGEASRADYGITGGDGVGIIFKKGTIYKKVTMNNLIDELFIAIESGENLLERAKTGITI
jgi:(E)-4-hydroxy-3-methylbut-2-enyl-diphosphate synthase